MIQEQRSGIRVIISLRGIRLAIAELADGAILADPILVAMATLTDTGLDAMSSMSQVTMPTGTGKKEKKRDITASPLNPKEARLLRFFMCHEGDTLTYMQILTDVWGWPAEFVANGRPASVRNSLHVHIHRLRRRGIRIQTLRNVGYRYLGQATDG